MKSILSIIPEKSGVNINLHLLKVWFNSTIYEYPKWIKSCNNKIYIEYQSQFKCKFFKRFITRYKFNKMIVKKIFVEKYNIYPDFLHGTMKAFLFPSINDLFKLT
jgi:hypothetical protein